MSDLFVLAATMLRVSTAIHEKGALAVTKESEILEVLSSQVQSRVEENLARMRSGDDELVHSLGDHALEPDGYTRDNVF